MSTADDGSHYELAENAARSTVKVHKVTYEWTIDHFDFCEAKGSDIFSPSFSAYGNSDVRWRLRLRPNGVTESKDTISLHFHLCKKIKHETSIFAKCFGKKKKHETIFAKYSASIRNNEQKDEVSQKRIKINEFKADGRTRRGWSNFCKKDENFREKLLSSNVLKIFCEIIFSAESDAIKHQRCRNMPYLMSTFADRDVTGISDMLFKTHLLSDVVISAQNKEYPAHKAILAARSKVFAAMFEHDTKENQLNRVEIEDMSEETVVELLRFIYTGKCEKLNEFARGLLAAADKYDLDLLKTICTKALCDNLSIENAAQILILADMHNADDLKSEVINFIVSKPTEVFNTDDWQSVSTNSRLIDKVCRAMARRCERAAMNMSD